MRDKKEQKIPTIIWLKRKITNNENNKIDIQNHQAKNLQNLRDKIKRILPSPFFMYYYNRHLITREDKLKYKMKNWNTYIVVHMLEFLNTVSFGYETRYF